MRRGFAVVVVTLLLLPGSVFALSFSAPPAFSNIVAEIESFIEYLLAPFTTAHQSASTASAAPAASAIDPQTPETSADAQETASSVNQFNATSTNGAPLTVETAPPPERTVYLQPQTIERTVVQSAPLPDDLVHTSLLAELLAAFESKISAKISAVTTPPPFPQQVAANGNGVFSYGAAAAASSGGGGSASGVSLSDVNAMVAAAIQAALSAIDHLTANTVTATNATLTNATVTTLHVTGTATLDSPLSASSGGTGISTAPSYGQLLLGQSNGTYALVSTSSLGISGGGGSSASSTLLADTNTWSAANTFSGITTVSNPSSNWAGTFFNLTASQLIGMGFSTTSAISFLGTNQGLAFSTTSASYYLANAQGLAFSTTSASYFLGQNAGAAFSTTSANYFANSSTTIPKTYTNNTFSGSNTFNGSLTAGSTFSIGSLNGPLQANNGVVSATTSVGVLYGGTGWNNITSGALLYGNGAGALATTSAGTAGNVLALLNGVPTWTATTTFSTGLTYANGIVTLNTSGDWSGTLNGYSASQLIGLGFSTTSSTYFITNNQGLAFSTTSANYYLTNSEGLAFSTTSASYFLGQNIGNAFSTTSANYFVSSSTTIPKTYTSNTFTNSNTFNGSLTAGSTFSIGSLNGPLQANNGVVSATTSVGVLYGGTGLTSAPSYGQLLLGQSNGTYALVSTSSLGITGGSGSGTVGSGTQGQFAFYNANGTTLTATSSLYLAQNGNIGIGTTTPWGRLSITGAGTGSGIAFATTDSGNNPKFVIQDNGNVGIGLIPNVYTDQLQITGRERIFSQDTGSTGELNVTGANADAGLTAGVGEALLKLSRNAYIGSQGAAVRYYGGAGFSAPQWSVGISANANDYRIYSDAVGLTALTVQQTTGNVGIGTTSPGSLFSIGGIANFTSATTSLYGIGGINIASGCFSVNGTCISGGGGGGSGTVSSGTQGQFAFYNTGGTTLTATSTLFLSQSGNIGIGTTTPSSLLSVAGGDFRVTTDSATAFTVAKNTGTSALQVSTQDSSDDIFQISSSTGTLFLNVTSGGNLGIGTTSPGSLFSIGGIANFTSATTSLYGIGGINIASGCFSVNGTCISGGGGGGSGTVSSGTQGQFAFYDANGTTVTATSTLFVSQAGYIGIGTGSPAYPLDVAGGINASGAVTSGSYVTSVDYFNGMDVRNNGGLRLQSAGTIVWSNSTSWAGTQDTGLSRYAANKIAVGNGTANDYSGTLIAGSVGIGTTSPDMPLSVGSDSPSGAVAHFENSTGSCYINPTTTSLSCSSDSRLKTNVVPLESAQGLAAVLKLNPVTYNWKTEAASTSPHTGFIAQDVQPILPDLVSQGPDGYYTLNYAGFTPYLVRAVQEIATLSDTFKTNLVAWLGSATNGIGDLFAVNLHASNELCVGDTCINAAQFRAIVAATGVISGNAPALSGSSASGGSGNVNATSTPPVISINGANPATISTGITYADLGATITAPQADLNLGITLVVDNATSTDGTVRIDTSTPGTHTILYSVTDPNGLTGSATRTVIVSPAQQTPALANDNTASSTATSTASTQ